MTSEKRQFIAVPRVGRSSEIALNVGGHKSNAPQSIPLNKILNHIYTDLLKRQGYIPTPRVGRSLTNNNNLDQSRLQTAIDFYTNRINHANTNRFKRSPTANLDNLETDAYENVNNNNNLIIKRQFLPPPRIGRRSNDDLITKETLALNQLNSNSIDGSSSGSDSSSNLGNFLQEEYNLVEPIDLRTMSKLIKWYQQNKNKQLLANALSEKRATLTASRLGRSAPLTPRLGRSYWELNNDDTETESEHNDRPSMNYYDAPISNRIIRTALTPRIGKRSNLKANEKVM